MKITERPDLGHLATFIPNKHLPIYDWFFYKEGFSRDLVMMLIDNFGLKEGGRVLDPFCGSGTTLLACRERGIDSIGIDAHPAAAFASLVKTRHYDIEDLEVLGRQLLKSRFARPRVDVRDGLVRRAFSPRTLEDVLFFREEIMSIDDAVPRDFFMLALMNVAMKCSYAWKDGAVIKIRKHPVPPLRDMLRRQIYRMIHDIVGFSGKGPASVELGDARRMGLEDGSVDAVITSPPYLNKIEYTKVYSIEEELFFGKAGIPGLRSYIGTRAEADIRGDGEPGSAMDDAGFTPAAKAYFSDMRMVIGELSRVCREGAKLGIVVGNGCFPDRVVESDTILTEMAGKAGLSAKEVVVLNKRWCTRNRVEKVGITRESLLIWEK